MGAGSVGRTVEQLRRHEVEGIRQRRVRGGLVDEDAGHLLQEEHVQLGDHLGLLLLKARAEAWPAAEGPRNEHRLLVRRKLWQLQPDLLPCASVA